MNNLKELLYSFGAFIADKFRQAMEWFMDLDLINKIIVLNTFTAFFAIVLPIAKYYIFESWFVINNPLAVYMIFIAIVMFATIFIEEYWFIMPVRVIINLWYFIYLLYMIFSRTISHAPYNLSYGVFFNIVAPLIYIAASLLASRR